MKGYYANWNYSHFLTYNKLSSMNCPYICRLIPAANQVEIEINNPTGQDRVYVKERFSEKMQSKEMKDGICIVEGLDIRKEYIVYVENRYGKSNTRLFTADDVIGTAVNYLHREDRQYDFSGDFLCSPSIIRLSGGDILISMDVYRGNAPQNLNLIFRSSDDGRTWHFLTELMPSFWGKLFCVSNVLYMLSVSGEYGDLQIGKSTDGGRTWLQPIVLARGGGVSGEGWHRAPCVILQADGKIYTSVEYGSWGKGVFGNVVIYAEADSDLLNPNNWNFTPYYRHSLNNAGAMIEGNLVKAPNGEILNILRNKEHAAIALKLNTEKCMLEYYKTIDLPVAHSKFEILKHENGKYYALGNKPPCRNVLSLYESENLEKWTLVRDIVDCSAMDRTKVGFQYPSFIFEGNEMLIASRTAFNGADSFHNSNYITFHKAKL